MVRKENTTRFEPLPQEQVRAVCSPRDRDDDEPPPSSSMRVTPVSDRPGFLRWAHEQLAGTTSAIPTAEIRILEDRLLSALRERDMERAMMLASSLLYSSPSHGVAWRIKTRCAQELRGSTFGFLRFDTVPKMRVRWESLAGTNLPRQTAFVLSLVDGHSTVEQLLDASSLPPLAAYDTLDTLLRDGIISAE